MIFLALCRLTKTLSFTRRIDKGPYGDNQYRLTAAELDANWDELIAIKNALLPISSSGAAQSILATTPGGRIVIAPTEDTSNGNARIQSQDGIYLGNSDNPAPNVLDWYAEGSFTPVLYGVAAAGVGTYTTQLGRYTRIGRLVVIDIAL